MTICPSGIRGREWARLTCRRRQKLVVGAFEYWRDAGFPYFELSGSAIAREFLCLQAQGETLAFRRGGALGSIVGLRLANFFQPHMWSVRVSRYRSPMDVFRDDGLLMAAIERAWTVWPDRFGANASCLRRMLKTFPGTASVSNFRPTIARAVIARYSPTGGVVVDFAAGFGGRLVGCLTLNRHYIGIEPSVQQFAGLRRTARALASLKPADATVTLHHGCAEDVLSRMSPRSAALVFSSPPYYDWERYSEHSTQSYVRYPTYEKWVRGFLMPVVDFSHRLLDHGGRFVLNVSNGQRLPTPDAVEQLAKSAGFELESCLPLLLARVPYLHPRSIRPYKLELLLVFRKRQSARR
jgi:hypothetical protein